MATAPLTVPPEVARRPAGRSAELPDYVRNLYSYTSSSLVGNLIGAVVLTLLYWSTLRRGLLAVWWAAFAIVWLYRAWIARRFGAQQMNGELDFRAWQNRWLGGVLASGLLWGAAGWFFYGPGDAIQQIAL